MISAKQIVCEVLDAKTDERAIAVIRYYRRQIVDTIKKTILDWPSNARGGSRGDNLFARIDAALEEDE